MPTVKLKCGLDAAVHNGVKIPVSCDRRSVSEIAEQIHRQGCRSSGKLAETDQNLHAPY